jgi:lipid-A-disaccharide synthase-like uncharacterized protein
MDATQFAGIFGQHTLDEIDARGHNFLFTLLNITSWTNLLWAGIGLLGQVAFFGRMFIQWVASERRKESVVPEAFWWLSLAGGVLLLTYFVWRQDFVGVLGQSPGIVIYARNIRRRPLTGPHQIVRKAALPIFALASEQLWAQTLSLCEPPSTAANSSSTAPPWRRRYRPGSRPRRPAVASSSRPGPTGGP